MFECYLSWHQISCLISLLDGVISANEGYIHARDTLLRSLSEDTLSNLDEFDLSFSDYLGKEIAFFRELKLSLEEVLK